jgi:hypothetical protein
MRTAELLRALSQSHHGIYIHSTAECAVIRTRYAPYVCGEGQTIFDAALVTARLVLKEAIPGCCPGVLKALERYDIHSEMLRV